MLAAGQVDVVASDNHGDRRSLATAVLWLAENGAELQSGILTSENPALLLAEEPMRPVPPVSFQRGVLDRLRELIFGSSRRTAANGAS
jgi:protein-tyrosine phosphatase